MTPEYLEELADLVDPDKLWQLPVMQSIDLPADKRKQLDAGVALRRYATHVRRLRELLVEKKSLLITPLSTSGYAFKPVKTPKAHENLRKQRS